MLLVGPAPEGALVEELNGTAKAVPWYKIAPLTQKRNRDTKHLSILMGQRTIGTNFASCPRV
jgi:hypothetical protein